MQGPIPKGTCFYIWILKAVICVHKVGPSLLNVYSWGFESDGIQSNSLLPVHHKQSGKWEVMFVVCHIEDLNLSHKYEKEAKIYKEVISTTCKYMCVKWVNTWLLSYWPSIFKQPGSQDGYSALHQMDNKWFSGGNIRYIYVSPDMSHMFNVRS